jgi:hypothetical protein
VDRRIVEVRECRVELADLFAEITPEVGRSTHGVRERPTVEPRYGPNEMALSVFGRHRSERRSVYRRENARRRFDLRRKMSERALLRVEHRAVLGGIRDLDDDAPAAGIDEKILIALARQLGRVAVESETFTGDAFGIARRKAWSVVKHP